MGDANTKKNGAGTAAAIQMGGDIANTLINQAFAEHNRKRNYYWNEKAADAADQRQRKQYQELYSPQAMLDQYAAAGLSPSMMMSGGQSATGTSSAQGNISSGISGPYPTAQIMDPMAMAEISLKKAQIRNLDEDTTRLDLENEIKALENSRYKNEFELLNNTFYGDENGVLSLSDLVNNCDNFDEFNKKVTEIVKNSAGDNLGMFVKSENGQSFLRNVYEANKAFSNQISVLANSEQNAKLMLGITELLNNQDFISKSANAQIQELEKLIEANKLNEREKKAFNNILDKMGENTLTDIAIVLLMLVGQWSHANLNLSNSRTNSVVQSESNNISHVYKH